MKHDLLDSTVHTTFTLHSIDALLSIVATEVDELGHAFLYSGDRLALDLPLIPVAGQKLKWGVAAHQDWAFEATLIRFARSHEPARLLIASGPGENPRVAGWIIGHSTASFWASRMPQAQAEAMFAQVPR